jgi:glutamine cyclotransferase
VERTVGVNFGRGRLNNLNELEYVNGKIFCNVLGSDVILEIEPDTGDVLAVIDCAELRAEHGGNEQDQPLNGIAYDSGTGVFYLTGKHWAKIYRVKFTAETPH